MISTSIGYISLVIIVTIWAVWGYCVATFLNKMLNKNLKYLLEPRVNFMRNCKSGARYDAININKWEVYFGAIFLIPIRLTLAIPIFILMYVIVWPIKKLYGGKLTKKNRIFNFFQFFFEINFG